MAAAAEDISSDSEIEVPKLNVNVVEYCTVCGLPVEYCEFGPCPIECAQRNSSAGATSSSEVDGKMDKLSISDSSSKAASKKTNPFGTVTISKENRTKKKAITQVAGLDMFGLRLKDVAKVLGKKFACGCSVVEGSTPGSEEIAIQGDFQYELADYIAEKMPEVPKGRIFFIEKLKKTRAFPEAADDDEANEQSLKSEAQAIIDDL